jgi:hypothetical protein
METLQVCEWSGVYYKCHKVLEIEKESQSGYEGFRWNRIIRHSPRDDGKLWVGTVTWTASKPVELVILHAYNNLTTPDAAHGVPLIAKPPTGAVAITLIGPKQFMPSSNPVPSGTADFVGSAIAFHTLSGAKFTVTYSLDAVANTPMKITPKTLS